VERVLLRALAITDPDFERGRRLATDAILMQPSWFETLGTFAAMQALATRQAADPMDVVETKPCQRALLAEALLAEVKPPEESEIQSAIQEIQERAIATRLRDLRTLIAEAERRGRFCRTRPPHAAKARTRPGSCEICTTTGHLRRRRPALTLIAMHQTAPSLRLIQQELKQGKFEICPAWLPEELRLPRPQRKKCLVGVGSDCGILLISVRMRAPLPQK
jgi:hypothetical protein